MIGSSVAKFNPEFRKIERYWGTETVNVVSTGNFTLKTIMMKEGQIGGLQYHRRKEECGYIVSGNLLVRYEGPDGHLLEKICKPGDVFHFPKESVHQEVALTDVVIVEASTPFLNDRVRVEKHFGLDADFGLPTTDVSEIEEL